MPTFPHYRQLDAMDCGPTCLRMIAQHYGKHYTAQSLREWSQIGKEGVSLLGISQAAERIGFRTMAVKVSFEKLVSDAPLPCIVHWNQNHFIVLYKAKRNQVSIADPARGLLNLNQETFLAGWMPTSSESTSEGVVLLLEPTPQFYEDEGERSKGIGFERLLRYAWQYKRLVVQLALGLLVGSLLQLIFPFLTQSVVDIGINTRQLSFVFLVLIGQLTLVLSRTAVDFIRGWLLLHISMRVNLSLLSDFLIKLTRLPMSFFDVKLFGDLMQRIGDHHRIEQFLTNQSLSVLFSLFNLVIFSVVLAYYNLTIFGVLMAAGLLYAAWVVFFLKYRRKLDFQRFEVSSKSNSAMVQLIQGMQEIKLANAETFKRWEWEGLQARSFRLSMKGLAVSQWQQAGALLINEGKSIFITFLSAQAVINGQLTLGAMLAVQYIIGQINGPIEQLIGFLQSTQDAQISLERLNEIYELEDEEPTEKPLVNELPAAKSLALKNLWFTYTGAGNEPVLKQINLHIPHGKTTAIVGMSGSGKTTLLKLLLRFYEPTKGYISLTSAIQNHPLIDQQVFDDSNDYRQEHSHGDLKLSQISHRLWRSQVGVVMQDGFIFSDTIARNIAIGESTIDKKKLLQAVQIANIQEFIDSLPLGFNTKIGAEGMGISQGQKQRILIARAVYKDPQYIFFDEATNALDAVNEAVIVRNLNEFFKGGPTFGGPTRRRTVVVVAHRLSTVKNADQIVVMDRGIITEIGSHALLTSLRGDYYQLVKNQLELGG